MTSDGFPETLNHIQYNPTTYAKGKCRGKYAYVFFFIWVVICSFCRVLYPLQLHNVPE